MENGGTQTDFSTGDNHEDSTNKPKKFPEKDAAHVKHKRGGLRFSASAHDLRCFDLEKEKEDASSPRGVLEACVRSFDPPPPPSPSPPSSPPSPESPELNGHCTSFRAQFRWSKIFKLWKRKPFKRLTSIPPFGVPKLPKRKSESSGENPILTNLNNIKSSLGNFSLYELTNATSNFSNENLIGKGGFSEVYKGCLQDGRLVAVKRLNKGTPDERTISFLSELGIIAHVDHPNTAKLVGCGVEGGMHLVFELSSLGSLGSLLHGSNDNRLDWSKRYKIALGIADGLLYLHESCHRRIIHRDIKAENILLTENYEPQICDFGLAKWLPKQWTHHNVSKFEGTFGYFAPEYFMHGIVDEKTDVYSFGVILLELITGRRALDDMKQSVVIWAKPLLDSNNIKDLVDPSLGDNYVRKEMERVVLTASLCVDHCPILRPRMSQVAVLLRGNENDMESAKYQRRAFLRTYSVELQDAQEYNSTKYLSNLNRLKQIALDS